MNRLKQSRGTEIDTDLCVKNYLTPDGIIILDEGSQFSGPADFKSMIEDNGLIISKVFEFTDNGFDYFMVIEHAK